LNKFSGKMPALARNKILLEDSGDLYFARWNGCTRGENLSTITKKMCNASAWVDDHEDVPSWSKEQQYDETAEEIEEVEDAAGKHFQTSLLFSFRIFLGLEAPTLLSISNLFWPFIRVVGQTAGCKSFGLASIEPPTRASGARVG
jgi:hypothetical protein